MLLISVVKGEELAHHHPPFVNIKDVTCPNTLWSLIKWTIILFMSDILIIRSMNHWPLVLSQYEENEYWLELVKLITYLISRGDVLRYYHYFTKRWICLRWLMKAGHVSDFGSHTFFCLINRLQASYSRKMTDVHV